MKILSNQRNLFKRQKSRETALNSKNLSKYTLQRRLLKIISIYNSEHPMEDGLTHKL